MANTRAITSDIWSDEWFGSLDFMQQALWIGLFSKCADMQGRLRDNAMYIRSQLWPYQDVSIESINTALDIFERAHKILRYEAKGSKYLQLLRWWSYQCPRFAGESVFPPPPGWADHIRTSVSGKTIERNWLGTEKHIELERSYGLPVIESVTDTAIDTVTAICDSPHIHIPIHDTNPIHDTTPTPNTSGAGVVGVALVADAPQMARIGKLVEDNFGLSNTFREYMAEAIQEYGADELEIALQEKVQNGGRTWKYVLTVLENRKLGIEKPPKSNGHGKPPARAAPDPMGGHTMDEIIRLNNREVL